MRHLDIMEEANRAASVMVLVDFEGEHVATVTGDTEFYCCKHYSRTNPSKERMYMGVNVYSRSEDGLKLPETCERRDLARNLISSIRNGLIAGATYFRLPAN